MTPNTYAPSLFPRQPARSPLNGLLAATPAQAQTTSPFKPIAYTPPQPAMQESGAVRPLPPVEEPQPLPEVNPLRMRQIPEPMQPAPVRLAADPNAQPMPTANPLQSLPWHSATTAPQTVTNSNVWKGQDSQYQSPLAGLLDQSQQFQGVRKLTDTEDKEPELPMPIVGGAAWSEANIPSDFINPFIYAQYQPTRRYEVL